MNLRTRVEILKGTEWVELYLGEEKVIKYNVVINRVGTINSREIKHSNTFAIPYVSQNIQALDINKFNPIDMASALNVKYKAKYYVREKLLQIGYIVVNNTESGVININFIDEALGIIEKWGATTYKDLITSGNPSIPSDYATNIAALRNWSLTHSGIVPATTSVGSRGNKLTLFPNNLNAIGEKFQILNSGVRLITGFNPYQSRPIWNTKAFFDLVTESFGYTPHYDPSVDWDRLKRTYLIESKLDSSSNSDQPYSSETYGPIASNTKYGHTPPSFSGGNYDIFTTITYPPANSYKLSDFPSPFLGLVQPSVITKTN